MKLVLSVFVPFLFAGMCGCSGSASSNTSNETSTAAPTLARRAQTVASSPQPRPVLGDDAKSLAVENAAMHYGDACREDSQHYVSDAKDIADCSKAITATRAFEASQRGVATRTDLDAISVILAMELFDRATARAHSGAIAAGKADNNESKMRLQRIVTDKLLAPTDLKAARMVLREANQLQQILSEPR